MFLPLQCCFAALVLAFVHGTSPIRGTFPPPDGGGPEIVCTSSDNIDMTFVIDGSGSIALDNFVKIKSFLANIVTMAQAGAQFAAVQYSSKGQLEFDFNDNADYAQVVDALNAIQQLRGGTRTGAALEFVSANLLTSSSGNRAQVGDVVIVLTDGRSSDEPQQAAEALRARGVKIIAVGVGRADRAELLRITGDASYVFMVDNFDNLNVALSAQVMKVTECKVIIQTTIAPLVNDCGTSIDIIFIIDGSGSISTNNFKQVKSFLEVSLLHLPADVLVAAVQYASEPSLVFNFNAFNTRQEQIDAILNMVQLRGGTNTGRALSFVTDNLLVPSSGNRLDANDIVIVLTDGKSQDDVAAPAQILRDENARILAVGVGSSADDAELNEITNDASLVYMVSEFSSLDRDLSERLMKASMQCEEPECREYIDLALVIDSSGSIGQSNYNIVLDFVSKIVGAIPSQSKVAALQYSTAVKPEFDYNRYQSVLGAAAAILQFQYQRGLTYTGAALDYVFSNWGPGNSGNRNQVDDIVLVVTDGQATDSQAALASAAALRARGCVIVAVGVGNADKSELLGLTGDADLVFMVGDFSDLNDQLMKLVMMATGTCASDPENPDFTCEDKPDGNYVNPFDACSPVWFSCKNGVRSKHHCNRGLRFDITDGQCHLPAYVLGCGGQPTVKPDLPPLVEIVYNCMFLEDGDYENPNEACGVYFVTCASGQSYTRVCPNNLYFDSLSDSCQLIDYARGCGGGPPPAPTVDSVKTVPPSVFNCADNDDGTYQFTDGCSASYISCSGGVGYFGSCANGTFYERSTGLCLYSEYVPACGGESTLPPKPVTYPPFDPPFPFNCNGLKDGGYPHPVLECSPLFVICSNGLTTYLECPEGLNFDVKSQSCLHRDYILFCGGLPTTRGISDPPTTQIPLFPFSCNGLADGPYADPNQECQPWFAQCVAGLVYYQRCGNASQAYDSLSQSCLEKQYVVDCGGEATTRGPDVTAGPPPFVFVCGKDVNGVFPNPENACSPDYVVCTYGFASFLRCPAGLNYDLISVSCLHSDYVAACGGEITTTVKQTPFPSQKPLFPFSCVGKADGNYAAPEQCQPSFAICSGGNVYYGQCSDLLALAFDSVSGQCLYKEYVGDCGGTPTIKAPESNVTLAPPPFEFSCVDRPDATYANPNEPCSQHYVICNGGYAIFLKCAGALKFDILSGHCLVGAYVEACGGRVTVSDVATTTPRPIVDFDCFELPDGFYSDLRQPCSHVFFSCVGSIPYEMRCPGNTYYDSISAECLRKKYVVACGGTATTRTTAAPGGADITATPPPFDCWNLDDGKYPPPNLNCPSFFFMCEQRETYRVDCPGSSKYNDGECVHPSLVPSCFLGSGGEFCDNRVNGVYRNEKVCNEYSICADGINLAFSCLRGQVFDPDTRQCKHPSEVYAPCGTKGPRNYLTCQHKQNGFFRSADQCSIYCQCIDGKKFILTCEDGYAYDSVSGFCIPAVFVVGCAPPPQEFEQDFCAKANGGGFYAHPDDCGLFILCLQDFPLVMNCQYTFNKPGTPYWSEALKTCVSQRPNTEVCSRRNVMRIR